MIMAEFKLQNILSKSMKDSRPLGVMKHSGDSLRDYFFHCQFSYSVNYY